VFGLLFGFFLIAFTSYVKRFWESLSRDPEQWAIQITNRVPYLPPRVLYRAGQPVKGPGAAEGEQVAPRLRHPQCFPPERFARKPVVPRLAHKLQAVRRVRHYGVHASRFQLRHLFQAVAVDYLNIGHFDQSIPLSLASSPIPASLELHLKVRPRKIGHPGLSKFNLSDFWHYSFSFLTFGFPSRLTTRHSPGSVIAL